MCVTLAAAPRELFVSGDGDEAGKDLNVGGMSRSRQYGLPLCRRSTVLLRKVEQEGAQPVAGELKAVERRSSYTLYHYK